MTQVLCYPGCGPIGPASSRVALRQRLRRGGFAALVALVSAAAAGADKPALDVHYVPTPQPVVDRMLQIAKVKASDYVMDVGCGDGRMVVTAAKSYGARGLCNDLDPERIAEAKANAKKAGVTDKIEFRQTDLYKVDLRKADVLPMYLLDSINLKLRPKILSEAKPGARVVSHAFSMGDWKPDLKEEVEGRTIYYWVVPARVDGRWKVRPGEGKDAFDLTIEQRYQEFTGQATVDGKTLPVQDGKIAGNEISFSLEDKPGHRSSFRGRVNGRAIEVVADSGRTWLAKRR